MEAQLRNLLADTLPKEGAEHYFAYCVENLTCSGWPHGDLFGLGSLLKEELQGQQTSRFGTTLRNFLNPLDRIPAEVTKQTLQEFLGYNKRFVMSYGITHTHKELII